MTLGLQTGAYEYTMPSAALDLYSVRYGSTKIKLDPTYRYELDRTSPTWESATSGVPTKYWTDGNKIGVYPKPNTTAAATVIHMRVLKDPDTLSTAADTPSWCPRAYHETIAIGAALDIAGGFDAQADGTPVRMQTLYDKYLLQSKALADLAANRSHEFVSRMSPSGYGSLRNNRA
jgi:hypothetical protein